MMSNIGIAALTPLETDYGCVFCMSGKETLVADAVQQRYPQVRATAIRQTKRRTCQGFTTLHDEVVLQGYVLFQAPAGFSLQGALQADNIISLLTYSDGDWRLFGDDLEYARFIFRHNGVIGLSHAYRIGDRIQIVDGPLKDLEGHITRVDRRNRSGQVTLAFGGNTFKVWLGFDIIEGYSVHEEELATKHA